MKSIPSFTIIVLFLFSCTPKPKGKTSSTQGEDKTARFVGDYVTPGYFKRMEGYDWMVYTITAHTSDSLKIEVKSRVDIKKPTCTFSNLAAWFNDSTLTYEITDWRSETPVKVSFSLSHDTLQVSATDAYALYGYCSGGSSLAGAYVKLKQPLDTFQLTPLTLRENALGDLKLTKGMVVTEDTLKKYFPAPYEIVREIGEQDGPNFIYYELNYNGKTLARLNTEDTESHKLVDIHVLAENASQDQYGMQPGYVISYLKSKRPELKIHVNYHFNIYLYAEGSLIRYKMTDLNDDGPDRHGYTWEELKGTHIQFIVWQ